MEIPVLIVLSTTDSIFRSVLFLFLSINIRKEPSGKNTPTTDKLLEADFFAYSGLLVCASCR